LFRGGVRDRSQPCPGSRGQYEGRHGQQSSVSPDDAVRDVEIFPFARKAYRRESAPAWRTWLLEIDRDQQSFLNIQSPEAPTRPLIP
jgi:hypothetical protein